MDWYLKDKDTVISEKNTCVKQGLTSEEAKLRQESLGLNKFAEKKKEKLAVQILRQFKDVAVIILLVAVIASVIMNFFDEENHIVEPIVIMSIIIINVILAVTQERGAEQALDALAKLNSPTCFVLRGGVKMEIDTTEVVPGDIVILKTGNLVPADARLLECESFSVDESSLTGESEPSEKFVDASLKEGAPLGDQKNMVFSGCLVATGHAKAVVVETGMNTQIGKIAKYLNETKKRKTPLQKRLDKLGKLISGIAIVSAFTLFTMGMISGQNRMELMLLTVALAVAAVPETLALIVTLILTEGVKKMVKSNALIRKIQAVETLGSTSVICSDKTGTLTQNRMSIKRLWLYGSEAVSDDNANSDNHINFIKNLLLASNVTVEVENGTEKIIGDPTESAIMRLAVQKGIIKKDLCLQYERVAEIPFSSSRKMMTVVVKKPEGGYLVLTKGAFDRIPFIKKDANFEHELESVHNAFAHDALRVITFASKEIKELPKRDNYEKELEKDLIFQGFIGIIDPPRPEAALAIARAKKAGIRTIMITGDHSATATAIARELGIIAAREGVITGQELANLTDDELFESIEYYSVYARVTPEDKIRIVRAWQRKGEVVSMTGDGVNDAPALKAADVGVAMGISGTEVAKSASDMVLTDDNFSTIVEAVSEGRNVFSNIKKLVYFLLVCNLSEIAIMLFGQVSGWGLPVTPIMLLIVNVLGDGIPGMALAKERSDLRIMKRKPIARNESFFAGGLMEVMVQQVVAFTATVLVAFYVGRNIAISSSYAPSVQIGQTMAFLVLGFTSVLHIFTVRSRSSVFARSFKENLQLPLSALAMLVLLTVLALIPHGSNVKANFVGCTAMSFKHWLIVLGLSIVPTLIAEYEKFWDFIRHRSDEKRKIENQIVAKH
ncbi:MAG: cation-translocating P-type ATPase [Firmicutes bacterium]|nr:cation-translocating P-type ATPase [Bacillota bacterium]